MVASRLLLTKTVETHKNKVMSRIKSVMEEVDMALYDRNSGIGFVYGNLGDLIKRVSVGNVGSKPGFFRYAAHQATMPAIRKDALQELKENMGRLDELHKRLNFMLLELEGLVKKS